MRTGKIIVMLLAMLVSAFMGAILSSVTGINVVVLIGIMVLGSFVPVPGGVLPMALVINSSYSGELLDKLLAKISVGNEVVQNKLVKIIGQETGQGKTYMPRIKMGSNIFQKRKATPVAADSKGDYTIDERVLDPQDIMVYTEFNPRDFEKFWRLYQPKGALVFTELPDNVKLQMLALLYETISTNLGNHLLNGVAGDPDNGKFFNGLLTRARADSAVIDIDTPAELTADNILDVYKSIKDKLPAELRSNAKLQMLCSWNAYDLYDEAVTAVKQSSNYDVEFVKRYKGIPLVPMSAMPTDTILCTLASLDDDSNLWAKIVYDESGEAIQVDRTQPSSELFFFKALLKADTQIKWGEHTVLYDYVAEEVGSGA